MLFINSSFAPCWAHLSLLFLKKSKSSLILLSVLTQNNFRSGFQFIPNHFTNCAIQSRNSASSSKSLDGCAVQAWFLMPIQQYTLQFLQLFLLVMVSNMIEKKLKDLLKRFKKVNLQKFYETTKMNIEIRSTVSLIYLIYKNRIPMVKFIKISYKLTKNINVLF